MKRSDSPAVRLLRLAWESQGHQRGHSWDRINHAMHDALCMAIRYGFAFKREDFVLIAKQPSEGGFNFGYWCGNNRHMSGEHFYSLAVRGQDRHGANRSAALAFEHWKDRKPFLVRSDPKAKAPSRIAIGVGFRWYDEPVTCTSFSECGTALTACSHTREAYETCKQCHRTTSSGAERVKHRHRIGHAEIAEYHECVWRLGTVHARLQQLGKGERQAFTDWATKTFPRKFTIPRRKQLDRIEARLPQ